MNPTTWIAAEDYKSDELAKYEITSIKIGKIFHWWTGRNAWHGVWSQKYEGVYSFKFTKEDAESTAERLRTPGTKFYIQEFPVLVFLSENLNLVVGEINNNTPLKSFDNIPENPVTLLEAARIFQPKSRHSIVRILSDKTPVDAEDNESFRAFKSYSNGSRYVLAYGRETEWDLDSSYISRLAKSL